MDAMALSEERVERSVSKMSTKTLKNRERLTSENTDDHYAPAANPMIERSGQFSLIFGPITMSETKNTLCEHAGW